MAIFGAVPATVFSAGAVMGAIAGGRGLTANWTQSALLLAWGVLNVAGVVGLWLAVLDRDPRLAVPLTGCGLIAALPLVAGLGFAAVTGGPPWVFLVALSPFVCGLASVVVGVRRWRRRLVADR